MIGRTRNHLVTVAVLLLGAAFDTTASLQKEPAALFMAVSDGRGRPVTGLTAADVEIAIDDRPQEILTMTPAADPASILLLTDRLGLVDGYTQIDIERALTVFVSTIRKSIQGSQFALTTFDGPVVRAASFAHPPAELDRLLGRLATIAPDAPLLDAVADAARQIGGAPSPRRAILLVYGGYRPDTSTLTPDAVGPLLQMSGASLWAIDARIPRQTTAQSPNRDIVVDRGSALSGGRRDVVSSAVGIETMARQIAALIGSQYRVTYGPGGGSLNSQLKVAVKRSNVRVHAPGWLAR